MTSDLIVPDASRATSVWDALVGAEPERRAAVLTQLVWLPLYLAALAVIWLGVAWGVSEPSHAVIQTGYCLMGYTACMSMVRFGELSEDRLLRSGYRHNLFGVTCIALAYGLFPPFRMLAVPMLCVVLVSDLRKYSTRQIRNAALLGMSLMLVTVPLRWLWAPEDIVSRDETMALVASAAILAVVGLVARKVKGMRARLEAQQGELAQTLKQLHELATKDGLTGLLNRREMTVMLEDEIRRQQRVRTPVSAALLDIDLFKQINDTHGHAIGDLVLRHFAHLAKGVLLPVESLARWGGEEFLLLAPGVAAAELEAHLAAMRKAIEAHDWDAQAKGLKVNFSAGVAVLQPGETLESWLERADLALYEAKAAGRARTVQSRAAPT